jgi:DNA recombination protein RmuC
MQNEQLITAGLTAATVAVILFIVLLIIGSRRHNPDDIDEAYNNDTKQEETENQILLLSHQIQAVNENVNQLQRLFRNVKLRGSWGEIQLGAILAEFLNPSQYESNVAIDPESRERVEFALKLPLQDNTFLWLPIDAKCPIEDFERLQNATEENDLPGVQAAEKALSRRILAEAADISSKYIRPPYSTDFALLFLPIESIYQWFLQQPELAQTMQQQYRVIACGPSTISAVLNLVQLSHQTLALSRSETEVWSTLAAVKQEMLSFDEAISKTQKKAAELTANLENMSHRLRMLERRLNRLENPDDSDTNL